MLRRLQQLSRAMLLSVKENFRLRKTPPAETAETCRRKYYFSVRILQRECRRALEPDSE